MGGLISSVALTLVVLPYISLGVEGVAAWVGRIWRLSDRSARLQLSAEPVGLIED